MCFINNLITIEQNNIIYIYIYIINGIIKWKVRLRSNTTRNFLNNDQFQILIYKLKINCN